MKINRIIYSSTHTKKFLVKEHNIDCWCTDVTSQEVIKKHVIKSLGHRARFHVTMLTNHDGYLGPFWIACCPKLDKKEKFFWWCMWHRTEFDLNVLFFHLHARKMPFNALVFTFRSKVDLIWTLAIRPVIAQSVHFHKISKKKNIDLCQLFFSLKGSTFLTKIMKQKLWVCVLFFCGRTAESAHQIHFLEMGLGRVSKWHICERGKKALKNQFLHNLHRDITVRTQFDKYGA